MSPFYGLERVLFFSRSVFVQILFLLKRQTTVFKINFDTNYLNSKESNRITSVLFAHGLGASVYSLPLTVEIKTARLKKNSCSFNFSVQWFLHTNKLTFDILKAVQKDGETSSFSNLLRFFKKFCWGHGPMFSREL